MKTRWFGQRYVLVSPAGILDGGPETKALSAECSQLSSSTAVCIILNFAEVPHLNSSGYSALVEAVSNARRSKKRLELIGADPRIQNIFVLRKLDALFETLYMSVQEVIDDCERALVDQE